MTPVVKYWVCKKAPAFIYEAMECLGGNGYVEESILPRLYREAPVNAIWEGSGNVMCLDAMRALSREGEAAQMVFEELAAGGRDLPGSAETASRIAKSLTGADAEAHARLGVEQLALLAAAAALRRQAPAGIAIAFAQANLAQLRGATFGSVTIENPGSILARALPG
jgi:putative acyl-CoA dehydrogenase